MKRKRVLAALACLCMTLALLPSVALAATATSVIVGGKTLDGTAGNTYATTDAAGAVTLQPSYTENDSWNIKFQNGVLTLKNATVAGKNQTYRFGERDCAIYAAGELKLVLVGNNTVYSGTGSDIRNGIYIAYLDDSDDGSLTIEGEGGGNLDVYAAAGGDHAHDGILVWGSLTINSGTITAEGRSANGNSFGVRVTTDFVMNGGTLTATGGDATGFSWGVSAYGAVTINGGTLTATAGTGFSEMGVESSNITINASTGGQVKVTAKTTGTAGTSPRRGFSSSPVISDGAYYTWSLTENNSAPTPSTTAPYSWEDSQTFTELTLAQACATPVITPAAGAHTGPQSVVLTCATAGATIRYTTDGADPTERSAAYSAAIPIGVTTTIKAKAFRTGMSASAVAVAAYTLSPVITDPAADRTVPVTVGDSATFSVTATNALSYLWQRSTDGGSTWNDLSATDRSYTTAPVTLQNNGYRYRCQVTVRNAVVTSHIFTLNVAEPIAVPATGDNAVPGLWLGLMLMAGAVLTVSLAIRRRRQNG